MIHGTQACYAIDGCRRPHCPLPAGQDCTHAHMVSLKRYRLGQVPAKVDSTGARRRVEALYALGWTSDAMAAHQVMTRDQILNVKAHRRWILAATADRVVQLYDLLSMQVGPSQVTERYAARKGWTPPLGWDDDTIDDPAAQPYTAGVRDRHLVDEVLIQRGVVGQRVKANPAERRLITDRWRAAGRSLNELDRIQGWNVHRDLRKAS